MSDFIEQEIARIRKLVGDKAQVIGAVSGGVDYPRRQRYDQASRASLTNTNLWQD